MDGMGQLRGSRKTERTLGSSWGACRPGETSLRAGRTGRQVRRFYSLNSGSGLEEGEVSFEVLLFSQKHDRFRSSGLL